MLFLSYENIIDVIVLLSDLLLCQFALSPPQAEDRNVKHTLTIVLQINLPIHYYCYYLSKFFLQVSISLDQFILRIRSLLTGNDMSRVLKNLACTETDQTEPCAFVPFSQVSMLALTVSF